MRSPKRQILETNSSGDDGQRSASSEFLMPFIQDKLKQFE